MNFQEIFNIIISKKKGVKNKSLDFILIDGKIRDFSTLESIPKIKSGGMLIIDNFQRYLPSKSISLLLVLKKNL